MAFRSLRRAPGWLPPVAVLVLALLPRLWQIDLTRFFNDQLELIQSAAGWLDTGRLPLTSGFTFAVTGAQHPPLVTYLLALPMLASRDPVWLSAWSAVLDAMAAPVVYLIAWRLTGRSLLAVAAGVLYALNPSAITFGRMIWNPDFALLFAALALLGLVDFAVRRRSGSLALSAFALSWQIQAHVVNVVLAPLWLAVAIAGRRKLDLRPVLLAGLLSLAPLAPYLYLQATSGWADIARLARYTRLPKVTDLSVLDTAAHLSGPAILTSLIAPPGASPRPFHYDPLTWLLIALAVLGLASLKTGRWPQATVVLWLALPLLAAISHTSDPQFPSDGVAPHYLLAILPALAVLQAQGLGAVWRLLRPRLAATGTAAGLMALAGALAWSWLAFVRLAATNVRDATYGMPLRYSLAAARDVRSLANNDALYLAAPFLYNRTVPALAGRKEYRWYPDQSVFVFPAGAGAYLAQGDTYAFSFLEAHFGVPAGTVANDAHAAEFGLFRLPEDAPARVFGGPDFVAQPAVFAGAIQLQGYTLQPLRTGQTARLELLWRILAPARLPSHLNQFAHLVDQSGTSLASAPDLYDIAQPWRVGDLVASSFDLAVRPDVPSGGAWLELGFYDTFSQQRLPVEPEGSSVRAGPLKVQGQEPPKPTAPPLATFDSGELALLSADWQGQQVAVDWQALRRPAAGYTVFVHAVDAAGKLVGQWDGVPRGGSYPTNLWDAGEVVHDVYAIGVPPAPGLHLEIGLYTQPDVKRLPVSLPGRTQPADHVSVGRA